MTLLGWTGWRYYLQPDAETAQQLEEQFGSEFFNSFVAEEPRGNAFQLDEKSFTAEVVRDLETRKPVAKVSEPAPENINPSFVSEEDIIRKYVPQFQSMEQSANSRLDQLFNTAGQEYRSQKAAGTLDLSALARKYLQAGTKLEAGVNSRFYTLLSAMENELIANHQPTEVIDLIKQDYLQAKAAKRAEMMAKARR
ncbi:MAG: hypothetical protein ABRQ23_01705 [Syntrophomonadaceae bacterium]